MAKKRGISKEQVCIPVALNLNGLAQLYSRVGFMCDFGNANDDLALLAESELSKNEFNAQLIKAYKGNSHRLSKLMRGDAQEKINSVPISAELVERYAGMLIS